MDTLTIEQLRDGMDNAARMLALARAAYHAAIAQALTNGTTQAQLVTQTGYKREQIRRIARAHGIGPAR